MHRIGCPLLSARLGPAPSACAAITTGPAGSTAIATRFRRAGGPAFARCRLPLFRTPWLLHAWLFRALRLGPTLFDAWLFDPTLLHARLLHARLFHARLFGPARVGATGFDTRRLHALLGAAILRGTHGSAR